MTANFDTSPKKWEGWKVFDETRDVWVFGFGSLVDPDDPVKGLGWGVARLSGYRRAWNVGMHNRHDRVNDKFFVTSDNRRHEGVIVSLGLEKHSTTTVNGVVFRVERRQLARLDEREKRYVRVDISDRLLTDLELGSDPTVFAYIPNDEALAVCAEALLTEVAVVSRPYHDRVERAFASLGDHELATYFETTRAPEAPLLDLQIVRPGTARHAEG